ncbi:MAG: sialate O-acetylesterase [Planctomycetota bacterium]
MVLQREFTNPVWGRAEPGEVVTVSISGQTRSATTGDDGRWRVLLDPLPVGGPHRMAIEGSNTIHIEDILVGDVWLCSGQSNMQWTVERSKDSDLERLLADHPKIRFLMVPNRVAQSDDESLPASWLVCSPETVGPSYAVAYFFAKTVHKATGVPIGLLESASGGSAIESWIPRSTLEADGRFDPLLESWDERIEQYDEEADRDRYQKLLDARAAAAERAKAAGLPEPSYPWPPVVHPAESNNRPANCYHGMIAPVAGYGLKGVLWYQGESNADRAYQYRELFPVLIQSWRGLWQRDELPFYWVQLAGFADGGDSAWPELREAQSRTLALPSTGQALAIDVGEVDDIHPRDKQTVGRRLARIALAREYGVEIAYENPRFASMSVEGGKVKLTCTVEGTLEAHNGWAPKGFEIAGADRVFHPAEAKIVAADRIVVWSESVVEPVAVRYAWARNPVGNVRSAVGLPLDPFRTDDWEGVTAGKQRKPAGFGP